MINQFWKENNIRFRRENRKSVLVQLVYLWFIRLFLQVTKRLKGIKKPIVHLYAVCWNEEKMLPFMLNYYSEFVSQFYIYDNYSDDNTDEILKKWENVTVRKYDTGGALNDVIHNTIKNNAWKKSRGKADWIIAIDMDEFLYSPNLKEHLTCATKEGASIFQTQGYDMYAEKYPIYSPTKKITDMVKTGMLSDYYSKSIIFNPNRIVEMNYMPGAHESFPEGIVKFAKEKLSLLHYKNLGLPLLLERQDRYRKRLSNENKEKIYGMQYAREDELIIEEFEKNMKCVIQIIM
ncbi:MAG: glycosyltransferase family 2 protein [Prevotellaceae bacterium]|jgi:hypothetical protein|nr:glycosyltransferase family 2 protein [Prevotellaceae bacterium]